MTIAPASTAVFPNFGGESESECTRGRKTTAKPQGQEGLEILQGHSQDDEERDTDTAIGQKHRRTTLYIRQLRFYNVSFMKSRLSSSFCDL